MDLFKVIAEMSGEGQNFVIPRLYVELAGGHTEALVLKQLVFWSNKTKRTDGFFYKKSEELEQETMLTRRQIDRIVDKLIKSDLIEVQRKKANGAPTRHFKIHQDLIVSRLHHLVQSNAPNGAILGLHETVQSITDSNTYTNNSSSRERIVEHYEKSYGIMPPLVITAIDKFLNNGFEDELIIKAIDVAIERGKKWDYAAGMLRTMKDEHGVKTMAQYKESKKSTKKARPNKKIESSAIDSFLAEG